MPTPAAGETLVRVLCAGICETDLQLIRGYMGFSGVLGHEFVGIAEEGSQGGHRRCRVGADLPQRFRGPPAHVGRAIAQGAGERGHRGLGLGTEIAERFGGAPARRAVVRSERLDEALHHGRDGGREIGRASCRERVFITV